MTNQTPLNPDALKAGHEAYRRAYYKAGDSLARCFEKGLSAYLTVAQPVVNSVEELDALPVGSLVRAGVREFYKTSYIANPWVLSYGVDRFGSDYLAKYPTEVIHRPEEAA
ncbi:hypothetical protein D3C74_128190 [compost metagenome]